MTRIIKEAYELAEMAHSGQYRRDGKNYISHPLMVYRLLRMVTEEESILCSGLLHDVPEDTNITFDEIRGKFGGEVADIVQQATRDENGNFWIKTDSGLMVKLADTLHNVADNSTQAYVDKKRFWYQELHKNADLNELLIGI